MSKHTPGPWHYRRFDEWTHTVVTNHGKLPDGRPSDWAVASINKSREPEHEANAQLISAAPDLLSVCKELADSAAYWSEYDVPVGIVDRLNAAIAKAEGI